MIVSPVCVLRHIYLSFLSCGLCTTCQVDRISKQAEAGHSLTYNPCDHLSCVDSNGDLLQNMEVKR